MQFKKSLLTATLLTVAGLTAVSSANASGKKDSDFIVSATILSVCTVDASGGAVSFTDVAAGTAARADSVANQKSSGNIIVMCSTGAPYVINLTTTGNPDSTVGEGMMTGELGGDTITYQLSSTLAGKAWGNTAALGVDELGESKLGNGVAGTGLGVSNPVLHPVYATITGSTDVKQDTYTDTITASVIY